MTQHSLPGFPKAKIYAYGCCAALFGGPCLAAVPEIDIADLPLHVAADLRPNLLLGLSLDITSVRAAYLYNQSLYNRSYDYLGYFNSRKCYVYQGGNRNLKDAYFAIKKDADELHECGGDTFSGNFMNWATSSQIDMLRYALTGGDRIIDTTNVTVLQRAVLPDDFYANALYFPRREIRVGANASAPNRVTPFDAETLYIVSCRNRILFSDSVNAGNDCDAAAYDSKAKLISSDKKLGEYLARVRVCDANEGPSRTDLCMKYGGIYKPVGAIQRHAARMRIGVMGYLLDDSEKRYGGVLRSAMKYVGPKEYSEPASLEEKNDAAEWDETTGILYPNPEDKSQRTSAISSSGVINYLNKFGRQGRYKAHDPLSELHYEGVRYLQGKSPTPDASSGMDQAMKDGFPVIDSRADPVTTACQRNYLLAIADADTAWDRYLPGNQRTLFNGTSNAHERMRAADAAVEGRWPAFDVKVWTEKVGRLESDPHGAHANPAPNSALSDLQSKDTGTNGRGTYYAAGLAYWANTQDIRLNKPIRVKSFVLDLDAGGNGQIEGGKRIPPPKESQLYLAAKYGGFDDRNKDGNPFVALADDGKTPIGYSDAEWDQDGNGFTDNYFLGGRAEELISSIRRIFSVISNMRLEQAASGVALSSTKMLSGSLHLYQAGYDPSYWGGSLKKILLKQNPEGDLVLNAMADWDAGVILTGAKDKAPSPTPAKRKIYTLKTQGGTAITTVPFLWNSLAPEQRAYLNAASGVTAEGQSVDGLGAQRVSYLRGERDLESSRPQGVFRARNRVLGDIVNSKPLYVARAGSSSSGDKNKAFNGVGKNRRPMIYVGANDGMLHAFDAVSGDEVFAYIPNALIPFLHQLAKPEYLHRPYADSTPAFAEIVTAGKSRAVLAAGMGGGAQGVFALDISDPANFGESTGVLWEFTDSDDADMGNLISPPQIARFRTKFVNGIAEYKYFVVVPSGLNNYRKDGTGKYSSSAQSALFMLSLDKELSAKWRAGINYYKIKLPLADDSMPNGLSAPALIAGADGAIRYAYAGDLQGNLWRFDFTGVAPWSSALGASLYKPIFSAKDNEGQRQPISMQPKVVFAPGGLMVLFGTGKYIEMADVVPAGFKAQSFYGIYDRSVMVYKIGGRSELVPRFLARAASNDKVGFEIKGDAIALGTKAQDGKGWYFDFASAERTGERSIANAVNVDGRIYFNTVIPAADACSPTAGRSYAIDALSGLSTAGVPTGYWSDIGLLNSPLVLEATLEIGKRDATGKRRIKKRRTVLDTGSGGKDGLALKPREAEESVMPAGRLSWREIINWQELRDASINK